jgi:hypothetical protein
MARNEPAALRDFSPAYVYSGSRAAETTFPRGLPYLRAAPITISYRARVVFTTIHLVVLLRRIVQANTATALAQEQGVHAPAHRG